MADKIKQSFNYQDPTHKKYRNGGASSSSDTESSFSSDSSDSEDEKFVALKETVKEEKSRIITEKL